MQLVTYWLASNCTCQTSFGLTCQGTRDCLAALRPVFGSVANTFLMPTED